LILESERTARAGWLGLAAEEPSVSDLINRAGKGGYHFDTFEDTSDD
jgi:hypothetical protein